MSTTDSAPVEIAVTGSARSALVDAADAELARYRWHLNPKGYARRALPGGGYRLLHRDVHGDPPEGMEIDHRNGDKLDDRRANLRTVTRSQNQHNRHGPARARSGHRNVYPTRAGTWQAELKDDRRRVWLGSYPTREQAAEVVRQYRRLRGLA